MTNKDRSFLAALLMILIVLIAMLLSSCSDKATRQLRRSEKLLDKAIVNGANVKKDTIVFHFKSPEISFSTTIKPTWIGSFANSLAADTLVANDKTTGSTIKAKISQDHNCPDSCNRIQTVYLQADIPPQDQKAEVPCQTIQSGYTLWDMVILGIVVAALSVVAGMIIQGRRK